MVDYKKMKIQEKIKAGLKDMLDGDLLESAKHLLKALGYESERTSPPPETPSSFFRTTSDTVARRNLIEWAKSLCLIFQITDEEISETETSFEDNGIDEKQDRSFYFTIAELNPRKYSRTKYAEMTREINKRYEKAPAVVFFRTDRFLTIAFVDRRPHKRDATRDVLGKVTLIKDINLENPHRAHLDILSELSLARCIKWMDDESKEKNFDGLREAWIAKLDTEELNTQFYKKLFNWFEYAIEKCTFPVNEKQKLTSEEHVIRLITRILFVWFIKEKGLISEDLFKEGKIQSLLKSYDPEKGDSYYRAILQNLFFATLNTEIDKRRFSKERNETHRNFSCLRYKKEMNDPESLQALFNQTPFINGGLFDCLDSEESTSDGGYRIDCFTDNPNHRREYSIPNRLFFDSVSGLIPLLKHYKFTVEENTPIEQEVALDPELLGKVFETLLRKYTSGPQEKKDTHYTPRHVVDYMVNETLENYLANKVSPDGGDKSSWRQLVHRLLDYADPFDDVQFSGSEKEKIIRAISEIKVLDPAVGSGAFPMSVLHRLTLALRRLDPENLQWESLQRDKALKQAKKVFETINQQEREERLKEINSTFERYRDSDFGRKLYLIQNSIFGVDIERMACQIAKLRFFISLAIECTGPAHMRHQAFRFRRPFRGA